MTPPKPNSTDSVSIAAIAAQVRTFASRPTKAFFELGNALSTLRDHHPQAFARVIADAGISRRRAYYVLEVCERFAPFMAHEQQLRTIGWTKLTILAQIIRPENAETLLAMAERTSTKQLASLVKDGGPAHKLRCVLLYLKPEEYDRFASVVVSFGGKRRGRQLINTEAALMAMLAAAEGKAPH